MFKVIFNFLVAILVAQILQVMFLASMGVLLYSLVIGSRDVIQLLFIFGIQGFGLWYFKKRLTMIFPRISENTVKEAVLRRYNPK